MKQCKVIRGGEGFRGKQGLDYFAGISAESCGSEGLCMHLLVLPPGAEARAHLHEGHESAIYVLEGSAAMRHAPVSSGSTPSRPATSCSSRRAPRISPSTRPTGRCSR